MKLSASALSILLTASATTAFLPPTRPTHHRTMYRSTLDPSSDPPNDDDDEPVPKFASRTDESSLQFDPTAPYDPSTDPIQIELKSIDLMEKRATDQANALDYQTRKTFGKTFLQRTCGVTSTKDLDPYDPDIYIRPRPGKYGWTPVELTKEYRHEMDKKLDGYEVPDGKLRDENLEEHVYFYKESVDCYKVGDRVGGKYYRMLSESGFRADPWFGLNERLTEAVKCADAEEAAHLKECIEKAGGPPPSLREKVNEEGYVPISAMYSITLSNERLALLIKDLEAEDNREMYRQERVLDKLAEVENDEWYNQEAWENYAYEVNAWRNDRRVKRMGEERLIDEEYYEARLAELDNERKGLMEQWKKLGKEQSPEEVYSDWSGRKQKLEGKLSTFAQEARRKDSFYEMEEEIEFDEDGTPLVDEDFFKKNRPKTNTEKFMEKQALDANGNPRPIGDEDVFLGELDPDMEIKEGSITTTGPLTVEINSSYNPEQSDPNMRKHTFQYTVRITNNSKDRIQLISREFCIQNLSNYYKDKVGGKNVVGRQPILEPGEDFEYTSTAPLNTRPLASTIIAARMTGEYRYCILKEGQETATEEQMNDGMGDGAAQIGMFHFVFPEDQRVKQWWTDDDYDEEEEEEEDDEDDDEGYDMSPVSVQGQYKQPQPARAVPNAQDAQTVPSTPRAPANSLPGDPDITSGNIAGMPNDSSDTVSDDVRVVVTSKFLPERSDPDKSKYCFAYNVRISNEKKDQAIQLVSRRFEIQNIGSQTKDVVQGANVTGRQPVLKPGENFEYTSTAPLSVSPMLDKTRVLSRMCGEYNCVLLADDGVTPLSSTPLKAELGTIHFILPEEQGV